MSKEHEVTIPIAGHAYMTVEADNEEEAINLAMHEVRLVDIENWEPLKRFVQGNVVSCPQPWEAEATCVSDDEIED